MRRHARWKAPSSNAPERIDGDSLARPDFGRCARRAVRRRRRKRPPPPRPSGSHCPTCRHSRQASASNFAQLTLKCVQKTYPNQPGLILEAPEDVHAAGESASRRSTAATTGIHRCTATGCSRDCCACSRRCQRRRRSRRRSTKICRRRTSRSRPLYFNRPDTKAFERTYGWAWTLKLARGTEPLVDHRKRRRGRAM